jgi:hypothetical protein
LRDSSCVVDLDKLPNTQGCYAIYLKSGKCLKVGIAGYYYGRGLRGRISRHFNGSTVGSIFAKDLADDKELGAKYNLSSRKGREEFAKTKCCVRFATAKGANYSELKSIEKYLVEKLNPKYFGYRNQGVKKGVPTKTYPLASRTRTWDSDGAVQRIRRFTNSTESPSESYKQAFMYTDYDNEDNFSAYKLPYLDVIDGRLKAVPKAVFAIASVLRGGRGGVDIPQEYRSKIERLVNRYYRKMSSEFNDKTLVSPFSKYHHWDKGKKKKKPRRYMKKNFEGTTSEIKYLLAKAQSALTCKKRDVCVIVNKVSHKIMDSELDWANLKFNAVIKNVDEEQRIVSGPVLIPEEVDKQGDIVSALEIEKAAHDYMKNYQHINIMHNSSYKDLADELVPIESAVLKSDLDYYGTGEVLKKGTWILDVYVGNDKIWGLIKKGELTGYSIEGLAQRVIENV